MGLFGPGKATASKSTDRATRAKIADGKRQGKNLVRVSDVKQRHSTGTGKNGTTIKGILHS